MARPTPAQYATGTATVVLATLALLLLTGTTGGAGVALIAAAALGLGLPGDVGHGVPLGGEGICNYPSIWATPR
ncbi:hypothetical protein AB0L20_31545 [Streptomyces albidoflavus]|uniref:hypothetical protein n=1 Tax=Streptomyces albidoflavus TaxID=1886 RepID=UPI003448610B